ncbi:MAG: prephenate dehydratase [Candidatus Pacearchaeota archaeon]
MRKIKIAFQGEPGAYSEAAAFSYFGSSIETLPCKTFSEVFEAVEKKKADFGIIPIENSLEGTIGQNYDLLLKSKLKIFGEIILRIHHCLIVREGVKLNSISRVYSHPQALGQCREFLEKHKLEAIATYDTAGSVKMLKEGKLEKNAAAIASERAAKVYGMKILKKGIETNKKNFTRFFIISRGDAERKVEREARKKEASIKTSIVFSTRHVPGALFKALEPFAKRNINLTKIESRPIIGKPWEYNFYLDFEGDINEKKTREALNELKKVTTFLKILGSYPAAKLMKNKRK